MAKLPSAETLGGLPSAASGRQLSAIDGSAIGQGMQTMASGMRALAAGQAAQGEGFDRMGRGIAAGIDLVRKEVERHDQINETLLDGKRNIERMQLAEQIANEKNPDRIAELKNGFTKIDENYASQIKDPVRRQLAVSKWQQQTTQSVIDANGKQRQFYQQGMLDGANNIIEEQRRLAVGSSDPNVRNEAIRSVNEQFDKLFSLGIISNEEELKARKRKFADTYTVDRFNQLPASERMAGAGGWRGALRARESTHNPAIVNDFGFAGLYQFGAPRLQTLGVYTPGGSEDMKGWNKSSRAASGKWSGTFNIPGFPGVKTLQDFLRDPAAQEAVFDVHQKKMDQEIKDMGLEKYIGETRGGVTLTRESLYAMMHLGGAGGAADALKGVRNREDAYGTKVLEYAKLGAEGGNSEAAQLYRLMPPERQIQMREAAERDWKSDLAVQERETKRLDTEWKADFDLRFQNASTAAVETGALPQNAPTTADFVRRYGDTEGAAKAAALQEALTLGQNIQRIGQMPDDEAKAMITAAKPGVNDPNYATRQKSYELLAKAYEQDRKARDADPAGYVQSKFPELAQAWRSVDANDPAAIAPLMARTNALQQQLGIPVDKRAILPKQIASRTVDIFKNDELPQTDRLNAVSSLLFSTNDPDQQRAIMQQLEREGMPGKMRAVFNAQARGDTGAARRLASAAMVDYSKLKTADSKTVSPTVVDPAIMSEIFDAGKIGDAVYGLSAGLAENGKRAEEDMELMRSYIRMEVANGKSVGDAIKAGVRDLYGDVKVYAPRNAVLALPSSENEDVIEKGLTALEPKIKNAINVRAPLLPPDAKPADKEAHRLAVARFDRLTKDMLANGEWRSFGKDVAFIDKATGLAVSGPDGKPLRFSLDQVREAAKAPKSLPADTKIPDMSAAPPDQTATEIARQARQRVRDQKQATQPVQQAGSTFGGGSTRLPQ